MPNLNYLMDHILYQIFMISLNIYLKKSYTCREGGAHLRISFWHLLMNLKNNYWANKNQNNFNTYNVAFFKENKEKHMEIYFTHAYQNPKMV